MTWHVPKLLASEVVSTATATKQSLYTVPTGKSAVVMIIEARSPSATLAGMTATLGVGFNAAADDWISGIGLTGLTTAAKVDQVASSGVTAIGSAGETFGAKFSNQLTNQTLTIDVWGYTF
jgi:CobQ-like glutamine amidotransferase family enzyme